MIAVEARENQIFLPIFFIPSFRQYVNVLSLICDTAFYLILRHNSAVQGDYPFSHPVYNLLTVGNNDYTLCCSPPESWFGNDLYFDESPTSLSISGTDSLIVLVGTPITRWAKATFSYTDLSFKRRKS